MARHWRMLPVPGFFDCSWAECDVDRGWPVATRNVLEEGYFQALYVPLGGSKTQIKNITSKSIKFYISMFNDKPPCMPLCFGIVERRCNHTARGGRGFFFFQIFFLSLYSRGFFYIFFLSLFFDFFLFLSLLLPLPLLS